MKNALKKTVSLIICVLFFLTYTLSLYAADDLDSKVEIKLVPGNNRVVINGKSVLAQKPFMKDNYLYIPVRTVVEAFGGDVTWYGEDKINIAYRDVSVDFSIGGKKYTVNQMERELPVVPVTVNDATMVPLQLVTSSFGIAASLDPDTNITTLVLEDDGALTDLTFLLDNIVKSKVGNSYFGWTINVPKGSRICNISFNSRYVYIENEFREMGIEIDVETNEGKDIEELYDEMNNNSYKCIDGEIVKTYINLNANPAYADFLFTNSYDEAVYQRVFVENGYVYNVKLSSTKESDPEIIKDNQYYKSIIDSFKLTDSLNLNDTQDLSKVEYGLARYENYLLAEDNSKYFTWELHVPPEWDILSDEGNNPFLTDIGLDNKEYVSIEIENIKEYSSLQEYGDEIKNYYDKNFNHKYYELLESKISRLAGYESYNLKYSVLFGKANYVYNESIIIVNNLAYDITVKAPKEKYEKMEANYIKMLNSLKISYKKSILEKGLEKYSYNQRKSRIGEDDNIVTYENKVYEWNIKLAGYWTKNSPPESEIESFINSKTGAVILIESLENSSVDPKTTEEERFRILRAATANNYKFINKSEHIVNGRNVKTYTYRIENDEEETFADVSFHIVDGAKYSYCYMSALPELTTSENNVKEMQEIWESFLPLTSKTR